MNTLVIEPVPTSLAHAPEMGRMLYVLARTREVRTVVEFGASFGGSTRHLAAAVRDNGGGTVITTETEPGRVALTRQSLAGAGLAGVVEILEGDARESLRRRRPRPIDLLFLDGATPQYVDILALLEPELAPGALVVADHAEACGYREYVRAHRRFFSSAVDERVELSLLVG